MKNWISVLLMVTMLSGGASAEILKKVTIAGTARIENATIMNYLHMKDGENITQADMDAATKTLFRTGLFSDVNMSMKNGDLKINVVENPIVHNVYFEGNKKLDDKVLDSEVLLKPRMVYTLNKVQNDAER